jgi:hypothetical protein
MSKKPADEKVYWDYFRHLLDYRLNVFLDDEGGARVWIRDDPTRRRLARHLRVSRARVTQVLRRLDAQPDRQSNAR